MVKPQVAKDPVFRIGEVALLLNVSTRALIDMAWWGGPRIFEHTPSGRVVRKSVLLEKRFISTGKAGRLVGVGEKVVRAWIRKGHLPAEKRRSCRDSKSYVSLGDLLQAARTQGITDPLAGVRRIWRKVLS